MWRYIITIAATINIASAQESASQPSSMPTSAPASSPASQCEACFTTEPLALNTAEIDKEITQQVSKVARGVAWASGASLGTVLVLGSLLEERNPFIPFFTAMTAGVGLNAAGAMRASNRYRANDYSRKSARRSVLRFGAASALQMSAAIAVLASSFPAIDEGDTGISDEASNVIGALVAGSLTSIAISTSFATRGIQDRTATRLATRGAEPKERRTFRPGAFYGDKFNRSSEVLAIVALGLTTASVAMIPIQSPLRDEEDLEVRLYVATSSAALTASTATLFSYGLYRHQQTKKLGALYATAGLMALQSSLRLGAATLFLGRALASEEVFGPSASSLSALSFAYGAAFSGVSALAMFGKTRLEWTKALTKKKRMALDAEHP
jgi:hypothetical protein